MKRILGLAVVIWMFSSLPLLAAKNSHTLFLPTDVRICDVQLPQGQCKVTWTEAPGSQVELTIRTENKKTVTIAARMVQVNLREVGIRTIVGKGVTRLQDFHIANEARALRALRTSIQPRLQIPNITLGLG